MRRPLDRFTRITSNHGGSAPGSYYGKHLGTDYAVASNTPVKAPVSGKVVGQGWSGIVGNFIEINGVDNRTHRVLHLNRIDTRNGATVKEGQVIGLSGSTGSSSTGPHVHWDARKAGANFYGGFANYYDTEALARAAEAPKPKPPTSKPNTYKVRSGDTLSGIGTRAGINWRTIASINGIKSPYTIYPGQVLKLSSTAPTAPVYTTVKAGEGLSQIAKRAGYKDWWLPTSWQRISNLNRGGIWVTYNRNLKPNQKVMIK